ncbi:hypothetical protein [Leptospira noguchii]|nr:hypothetical protein [Leptospira noguchii]UOG32666.1 hypothetical protein MAL06_20620 [Leptospira noguchii]UOG36265.1 hypothetical protein MAL02_19175 [Leptospira noguchii]UOG47228.1 hypothetical protein MAL01_19570 [Leptospira noguchii]UOG50944.1 hypothetical protein MAL00_19885 [Leptospira noguchii]
MPTTLYLKTILSLLGEEIVGKWREKYSILNPDKSCDSTYKVQTNPVTA